MIVVAARQQTTHPSVFTTGLAPLRLVPMGRHSADSERIVKATAQVARMTSATTLESDAAGASSAISIPPYDTRKICIYASRRTKPSYSAVPAKALS